MGRRLASLLLLAVSYGALEPCKQDIAKVLSKFRTLEPSDVYGAMAYNSGKTVNDLGDYFSCIKLEGAEYVLFTAASLGNPKALGFCGPQSCMKEDYLKIIGDLSDSLQTNNSLSLFSAQIQELSGHKSPTGRLRQSTSSLEIIFPEQYIQENLTSLSGGAIVMLIICILLVIAAVAGTVIDINQSRKKLIVKQTMQLELMEVSEAKVILNDNEAFLISTTESKPLLSTSILLCFSLYTNLPKLLTSRSTEKLGQRDPLDILNGVRVISLELVVLGHLFVARILGIKKNMMVVFKIAKAGKTALIYGSYFAVDSFFWISGFLMAFFVLQQLNSPTSLKFKDWVSLYIHRIYRILPTYAFILFLVWAFTKYLGNGPLWYQGDNINDDCPPYWWSNLLFMHNFIPWRGSLCVRQAWYLANDMQFFIVTPPMLYLYHHVHKLWGWLIVAFWCGCSILSSCLISQVHGYNTVLTDPKDDVFGDIYIKPYCRIAPYAVGVACGMILYSYRHYKKTNAVYDQYALTLGTFLEKRYVRYCNYVLVLFLINLLLYIQYDAYQDIETLWTTWTQTENSLFIGFSHFLWGIALSLLLLPMLMGFSLIPTWFLSLGLWTPLAKLSFCVYLIHIHLINIYTLSLNAAYWYNDLNIVVDLTFITLVSYGVAVPLTLLVENPCMALEKLMKSRGKDSRDRR